MHTLQKVFEWRGVALVLALTLCPLHQPLIYAAPQAQAQTEMIQAPVNINSATAEELQSVRGIGPALAERIVQYRKENGSFRTLEDLTAVRGIGQAKLQRIKSQITI